MSDANLEGAQVIDPYQLDTRVISTVPTANATGAASSTDVKATFSEDMMPSSINGQTFKLFDQGSSTKIAAAQLRGEHGHGYARPDHLSTKRGITYKAVVTTGAKDSVGNPLAQQYKWFFTVR